MQQESVTSGLFLHTAKKRPFQERETFDLYQQFNTEFDPTLKKTKFMQSEDSQSLIGPIILRNNFGCFNQNTNFFSNYCQQNVQPVSFCEIETKISIENQWQSRMDNCEADLKKKYEICSTRTNSYRAWLEERKNKIKNEMYIYNRQLRYFEGNSSSNNEECNM